MIYNIPTDYCYDRYGDRWDWNKTDYHWQMEGPVSHEYPALNELAEARGPLSDTPLITVGTVLVTVEKCDACPPGTVAYCPGMLSSAVKTGGGKWIRTGTEGTSTSKVIASAPIPYTVIYIPEVDESTTRP